ncbi:hypothetical protein Hanom_Chr14g01276021 [Helianthus anomalus]
MLVGLPTNFVALFGMVVDIDFELTSNFNFYPFSREFDYQYNTDTRYSKRNR